MIASLLLGKNIQRSTFNGSFRAPPSAFQVSSGLLTPNDLSFLSRERAEIWRWCGAATKNWVELNSAVGGRTCLDFPQRFCLSSRPVCPEPSSVAKVSEGFAPSDRGL